MTMSHPMSSKALPEPNKYLEHWPKTTKDSPKGHYVTYIRGPGKHATNTSSDAA